MIDETRTLGFRFTGRASEYFRIWIIGVALSVLTFGAYSAWAKVRTQQYIYRHTWLDDTSFEYLAAPRDLLAGRLLLAAVLVSIFVLEVFYSAAVTAVAVAYIAIEPWVVVRSMSFRARSSSYRNVRFSFRGRLADAYRIYSRSFFMLVMTCGLAYPVVRHQRTEFLVGGLRYGALPATWSTQNESFVRVYLETALLALPAISLMLGGFGIDSKVGAVSLRLASYGSLLLPIVYLRAALANLTYGGLELGVHRLSSRQRFWPLLQIYVTNTLAVVATLGLAIPWAKVRLARYCVESLALCARGSLDVAAAPDDAGRHAYGDAAADLGGIDVGIS